MLKKSKRKKKEVRSSADMANHNGSFSQMLSATITAKDIKKEKENTHGTIHSEPGPIRSRLAEHNQQVELGKSIRSKLFPPVRTFSQSPLSSVWF